MLFKKRKALEEYEQLLKDNTNIRCTNYDALLTDAALFFIERGQSSNGALQRRFSISFGRAEIILQQLESVGIVGKEHGLQPRTVLIKDKKQAIELINTLCNRTYSPHGNNSMNYDNMEGHDFEYFCAGILRKNGFINVEVTQGSGDHGIDVLAEKDDISYAIQCKCYSSNVGNAAVQQAHTGKSLYNKDVAVVMTNQYFTQQAREEARKLRVKLWDRDKLNDFIEKSEM